MVKVNIYKIDGSSSEKIELPPVFNTSYRPDLIKKSFNILRANKRQPYGSDLYAGAKHSTASIGKGHGTSRVPRVKQDPRNRGGLAPGTVGGRRAHPPKVSKNWSEKINKKEKKLARYSAFGALSNNDIVQKRGHKFNDKITLPVVIDDKIEKIDKTNEIINFFKKIGIYDDIERAVNGKHIRAGKGKIRGRKYKTPKSILIISDNENIKNACKNITGVDIVSPSLINVEDLAPGGEPGRLTVISKSALKKIGGLD